MRIGFILSIFIAWVMKLWYHIYRIKSTGKGTEKRVKGRLPLTGSRAAEALVGYRGKAPAPRRSAKETRAFRESNGFEKQLTQPQRRHSLFFHTAAKEKILAVVSSSSNAARIYLPHHGPGARVAEGGFLRTWKAPNEDG